MKRPLIAILTGLLLCMNVNAQELKKATTDFSDYISLLKKSGYDIYSFDISSLKEETYLISFMVKEYSNGLKPEPVDPFGYSPEGSSVCY